MAEDSINLIGTFHSGFVNSISTSGFIGFMITMTIIIINLKNVRTSLQNALFYYSIVMISLNAYGSFFGTQIEYLILNISLYTIPIKIRSKTNNID